MPDVRTDPTIARATRRAISPYARRLARDRAVPLSALRGSGPAGRIVAADVIAFAAKPDVSPVAIVQTSAFGTTIHLAAVRSLLETFASAGSPFDLDDVVLRAAGCALDDIASRDAVALETSAGQIVFAHIRKSSLAPQRARRLKAIADATDQRNDEARLSVRLLVASGIRPVTMPLLPARAMRLALVAGPDASECLLTFDTAQLDEAIAADFLGRFKAYLEAPILLLA